MLEAWFICPYDIFSTEHTKGAARRCLMTRYIPALPDGEGSDWDEAEILGNHTLVWILVPDATMALIRADSDFTEIPLPNIPPGLARNTMRTFLVGLGYELDEVNGTDWDSVRIFDMLTIANNRYVKNPSNSDELIPSTVRPGRQPPRKLASQITGRSRI